MDYKLKELYKEHSQNVSSDLSASAKQRVKDKVFQNMHNTSAPVAEEFSVWTWLRDSFMMRSYVIVPLALVLFVITTTIASATSLPGDFLYPLKRQVESARIWLAPTPEAKMELQVDFAEQRLEELKEVQAEDGKGNAPANLQANINSNFGNSSNSNSASVNANVNLNANASTNSNSSDLKNKRKDQAKKDADGALDFLQKAKDEYQKDNDSQKADDINKKIDDYNQTIRSNDSTNKASVNTPANSDSQKPPAANLNVNTNTNIQVQTPAVHVSLPGL